MEVLANSMVVIILQYLSAANQHVVHLNLTQCCMSVYVSIKLEIKEIIREIYRDGCIRMLIKALFTIANKTKLYRTHSEGTI